MFFSIFMLLLTVLVFIVNLVVFVKTSSVALPPGPFVFRLFVHQTLLQHVLCMMF